MLLAENFFQQAIDLDPRFADGYCGRAVTICGAVSHFQTCDAEDLLSLCRAIWRAKRSRSMATMRLLRAWLSYALYMRGDPQGAVAEAELALALSPNLALGYRRRATA